MTSTFFIPPVRLCGYPSDTPMLLALSGGADSRLLLHLCAAEAKKSGVRLHLAHVNHGIRGDEANRDEQFCRALAEHYGLPLHVLHADVPATAAASGESLEMVARRIRYDYFAELMRKHCLPILLTAHHADDNLETVLFHLIRGTGLCGLGGIAPVRSFEQAGDRIGGRAPVVVRPLLSMSKQDILQTCRDEHLEFVTDSTNADVHYARNRLRCEVLPSLATIVEHPERQVVRNCATLREDEELLRRLAAEFLKTHRVQNALPRAALADAHPAIAKRVLRRWVHELTGHTPEQYHLQALLALCQEGGTSHSVDVLGGYTALADKMHLHLQKACVRPQSTAEQYEIPLPDAGHELVAHGLHVRVEFLSAHIPITPHSTDTTNVYNPFIRDTLSFDTMIPYETDRSLMLRPRRAGDTLLLRGKHHKLRKLQNERGIPPSLRDRLPLLCDGDGVVWAPLIGLRDGISTASGERLHLTVTLLSDKDD